MEWHHDHHGPDWSGSSHHGGHEPAAPAWPDPTPAWPDSAPAWSDPAPAWPDPVPPAVHEPGHHAHAAAAPDMPGEMSFAAAPTAAGTDATTFPDVRAVGFDGPGTPVVPAEWIRGPERGWEGGSGSPANPPSGAPGSRRGTLSLVLGLLAIVLFVVQFGLLSVAAMVLGIQHLRTAPGSAPGRRSAVLGIVLGALSLLPSLLMAVGILAEL